MSDDEIARRIDLIQMLENKHQPGPPGITLAVLHQNRP